MILVNIIFKVPIHITEEIFIVDVKLFTCKTLKQVASVCFRPHWRRRSVRLRMRSHNLAH